MSFIEILITVCTETIFDLSNFLGPFLVALCGFILKLMEILTKKNQE